PSVASPPTMRAWPMQPVPTRLPSSARCSLTPTWALRPNVSLRPWVMLENAPLDIPLQGRNMSRNEALFDRAARVIPGGVNSPVRAFRSVGGTPRFIERAAGPYMWDAEGTQFIDYLGSWGPAILGHAHPAVVEAVQQAATNGLSFGAPTEAEVELAERLVNRFPSIEQIRLV